MKIEIRDHPIGVRPSSGAAASECCRDPDLGFLVSSNCFKDDPGSFEEAAQGANNAAAPEDGRTPETGYL